MSLSVLDLMNMRVESSVLDSDSDRWYRELGDTWVWEGAGVLRRSSEHLVNDFGPITSGDGVAPVSISLTESQAAQLVDSSSLLGVVRLLESWGITVVAGE